MAKYLVRRILQIIPVLIIISMIVFLLVNVTGDPTSTMLPPTASDEERDVLREAETAAPVPQDEALLERIAVYFAYRSVLKCVNDGDLLGRGLYTVFLTLAAERIAAVRGLGEALRRLSREVEHDADNGEALLTAFREDAAFDLGCFLRELRDPE